MLSKDGRTAAEKTRQVANIRNTARQKLHRTLEGTTTPTSSTTEVDSQQGFGPGQTRIGMFWRRILPKYVLPLFLCTKRALFTLLGLASTYQLLNSFKEAPKGDLNFQLNCTSSLE